MKVILLFCSVLLLVNYSFGQPSAEPAFVDLVKESSTLNLDRVQTAEVGVIADQLSSQIQELTTIKNSDPVLYQSKLQGINLNALAKLRNLLRPEQLNLYRAAIAKQEQAKIAHVQQMRANGATKDEIDTYLNN